MTYTKSLAFLGALGFAVIILSLVTHTYSVKGSTVVGNDYIATSTAENAVYGAFTAGKMIKRGAGSFGSIVITGANTGVINIYNATTTDVNLRTGNKASSSILMASIPASMATGTYTFDVQFSDGLYLDLVSGTMPTTTVTYR